MTADPTTAKALVDDVLPDPWRSSTTDTLVAAVLTLREEDVPDDTIRDVLTSVVGAMSSEYGE
jgi:hypothetical protein